MLPIIALVILFGSYEGYRFIKQKNYKELTVLAVFASLCLAAGYMAFQPYFPGFAHYVLQMLNITRF